MPGKSGTLWRGEPAGRVYASAIGPLALKKSLEALGGGLEVLFAVVAFAWPEAQDDATRGA